MQEAYKHFVEQCKNLFGWKDEDCYTWEQLTDEEKLKFEQQYTFILAMKDAAGAENRFRAMNND